MTLADLLARVRAATPGPWKSGGVDRNEQPIICNEHIEIATLWHHSVGSIEKEAHANAKAIIVLRNVAEALIAEVMAARAFRQFAGVWKYDDDAMKAEIAVDNARAETDRVLGEQG